MTNEKATEKLESMLQTGDPNIQLEAARLLAAFDLEQQQVNVNWATNDRRLKIMEAEQKESVCAAEIDRLAKFILEEVPDAVDQSEGAVDTAIRLIRSTLSE